MLTHLYIQNYALISHLDLSLSGGFSVMTGETGAGKSIILGALALVMGGRADLKAITDGEERCVIETEFNNHIVRRELYSNGKSRSFVDDSPVRLDELKALAAQWIDIHSQHENLLIADDMFQLSLVDTVANNEKQRQSYAAAYSRYRQLESALAELQRLARKAQEEADYIAFRYQQLADANLQAGEWEELSDEHYRLSHAQELQQILQSALLSLDEEEGSVLQRLHSCRLEQVNTELEQRLRSAEIELRDIANEVNRQAEQIEQNPQRLEIVEERIGLLQDLMRKYQASDIEQLIAQRDQLEQMLGEHMQLDDQIASTQQALNEQRLVLDAAASELTQSRQAVSQSICRQLDADMRLLGVTHAKTDMSIQELEDYTESGKDDVQILFAANLNQSLRRVSEVASGGEISRLMLCIKSLMASQRELPTIIFDEIDTGVSGEIATQMGQIMRQIAQNRQVLVITHLPQIAALGDNHYRVYKADTDLRTETHIELLNDDERITEIATMLSGRHPSDDALRTAQQLIQSTR